MSYSKLEILSNIFDIENIAKKLANSKKITHQKLLQALSLPEYSLTKELGVTDQSISKLAKKLWPEKGRSQVKICSYLLHKYGYKYCAKCNSVKEIEYFSANKSTRTGLASYCKACQAEVELPYAANKTAKYRASKLHRTPVWLSKEELDQIAIFYANCPEGYEVDHILPLQGKLVSGLHVLSNLQYLTKADNAIKNNSFVPT